MLCEWLWTRVDGMSRIRLDGTASVPDDRHEAPRWFHKSTVDYLRPIMKESSLLMRLYDERTPNENDEVDVSSRKVVRLLLMSDESTWSMVPGIWK